MIGRSPIPGIQGTSDSEFFSVLVVKCPAESRGVWHSSIWSFLSVSEHVFHVLDSSIFHLQHPVYHCEVVISSSFGSGRSGGGSFRPQ